jgi:hypothetical protein
MAETTDEVPGYRSCTFLETRFLLHISINFAQWLIFVRLDVFMCAFRNICMTGFQLLAFVFEKKSIEKKVAGIKIWTQISSI